MGFYGGVFDGRYLYMIPYHNSTAWHGLVARYDTTQSFTSASAWTFYNTAAQNSSSIGFIGGVFDGRYLYMIPYFSGGNYGGLVARYDTTQSFTSASAWTFYDTAAQNSSSKGFKGGVFDGRYLYMIPAYNGSADGLVTRYDTTQSFTSASAWTFYDTAAQNSSSKGFSGGVFDGRYLYMIPTNNGSADGLVTRYDTTQSFTSASAWTFYDTAAQNSSSKGFERWRF